MKKTFIVFIIFTVLLMVNLSAQVVAKRPYIGIHAGNVNLLGGEPNQSKFWAGGQFGYYFSEKVGLEISAGYGWTRPKESTDTEMYITYLTPLNLNLKLNLTKGTKFTPYFLLGAGILQWDRRDITGVEDGFSFSEKLGISVEDDQTTTATGGLGANWFLSSHFSLEFGARFHYLVNHTLDMNGFGGDQVGILEGRLGFNIHFGKAKDSDGDGIIDSKDGAIFESEDFDDFQDEDGIPDPDNDGDGILDVDDGAPNDPEDIDGFEDEDGIPDPDNDGDGILDVDDKSPNIAEDFDGYMDDDGAPDLDNDGDGILDYLDQCPNLAETFNGYKDDDGCPDEKPLIFEGVTFRPASDYLHLDAKAILDEVVKMLRDRPNIKMEINGYTDSTGPRDVNMDLSYYRAIAVKKYLVSKGISESRLIANGYGPDNPIASNNTEEGRRKNRRIEFVIIK
ncbi:MAG: OmpA family protein [Candidatus Cloacimonetes bacterium]|nr:OmpA family protein [Candidatus Cloacimonadota bacterium]MCF7815323.1 OmpA family protein [Candidatus Cloacimonadota bacterium]MCF7883310.1 OmpA family protein [Candidatus Cloacimonadota bacterium]